MRCSLITFVLASTALAYEITSPNADEGWTNSGAQTVSWSTVSTDASNFTILLINQSNNQDYSQVLDSLVEGDLDTISVNAPSGGWPTGSDYRVNFVKSSEETSTIYAQSDEFNITAVASSSAASGSSTAASSSGSSTAASSSGSSSAATTKSTSGTTATATEATGSTATLASATGSSASAAASSKSSSGAVSNVAQKGLIGLAAVLGFMTL
ncbi:hypothetical protein FISHEDRAFT_57757 [Fistulina hepatica ATCC 64428]|uniref:Yeast cell wall synthesis Kre9/Knh1-like N-terminal domain-containing protein n=1 Tax=Fistulina hepatica ATCC 64428 TaxID=1128425 RepID=A0A0D7AI83_9AGAR|nr:hypothetical protein FISHEDRAFT_57757 [Fistulina hepatica ATCC 64428]